MNEELKPVLCGCGGEPEHHVSVTQTTGKYDERHYLMCKECLCTISVKSYDDAIRKWNTAMSGNRMRIHTVTLAKPGEEAAKPYKVSKNSKRWHCGRCSTAVGRFWEFCQKCGTRIDWSVRNEDHLHE